MTAEGIHDAPGPDAHISVAQPNTDTKKLLLSWMEDEKHEKKLKVMPE